MRVASWNVNGLRARLDFVVHWLQSRQPDVVGLQELKLPDEKFPHAELLKAGYRAVTHGQKSWSGVAILSREPAEALHVGLPGWEELGARFVSARIDGLAFATAYIPNGKFVGHPDFARKLEWLEGLAEHFEKVHRPEEPILLCGDFNVCPTPLDSWNEEALRGHIFHTEKERARIQRLFDWGFRDAFRERFPDVQAFSWWDYRAGAFHRGHGLRIDLLLATPSVMERVRSVEIDRDYRKKKEGLTPSDHAPVIADI